MKLFSRRKKRKKTTIFSPMNGSIKSIEYTPDPVFSQKMMGDGIVVFPTDGIVAAPFDGKITMVSPNKHALGLKSDDGIELLIHYGLDTVCLQGEGFELFVEVGKNITKGDKLLKANNTFIEAKGLSTAVSVIFTALNENQKIEIIKNNHVSIGDPVINVVQRY